jgi:hypothetical protein
MVRKLGLFGILLVLSLAFCAPAWAQIQNGSIFVKTTDEQGAAVPGATVNITAPVLPSAITGVTDSAGNYRSPLVPVGTYIVKVSLQGFQTISRENVVLLQSQTITLDFTMKVSTVNEELTVKGESPVVDTKSTTVNVNLDKNLLENTPGGKDIWNILEYKVPGLIFDSPDVGGNQAGLQRAFTARGTPNSQNVQLINGSNVGDPAAIGFSMNYYDPNSFENIQVSTGSQDISMGTSGVVVNLVSKSGTNVFSGQGLYTYQGHQTQWDNIDTALKLQGFRPNANAVDYIANYNAQAGGPAIKNKLFYFGSVNFQPTHVFVPGFPIPAPTNVPTSLFATSDEDTTDILTGAGKFTYQMNASHRFDAYVQKQRYDKPNRGAANTNTQDSNLKEYDIDNTAQILWNWVVSDKMFANTNLSYNNVHFPLYQKTGLQPITDNTSGTTLSYRNTGSTAIMFRRRLQFTTNWQYFIPQLVGGRHEFKIGFDNAYTPEDVETDRVDNVNLTTSTTAAGALVASRVTVFNSPLYVKRAVNNSAIYGQDSYSIGRLNLVAGIRWERVNGSIPAQTHPSSQYFPTGLVINGLNVPLATGGTLTSYTVQDSFASVNNSPLWKNWAPRVSGIYDLTGQGKTVLKASWGEYYDQIGTGTPGPNPNGTVSQQYNWNDTNGDLVFQPGNAVWNGTQYVGGEFGSLRTTNVPNPNPFDPTVLRTYRVETTVGIDKEIWAGVRGSATYIHRRDRNPQSSIDVGSTALWPVDYTPVTLTDPGPDGKLGTSDDVPFTVYDRLASATVASKTVNDDRLSTFYNGLELTVTKRYANGFSLVSGYTYSHTTTDLLSLNSPNSFINAAGENGGRRHLFKLTGSYLFPHQITFGANLRMQSGLPTNRTWSVQSCSSTVTVNCIVNGTTVNVEPRGDFLLPSLYTVDLRVGKLLTFGKQRFEFDMDVYNLTNANTVYSTRTGTGVSTVIDYTNPAALDALNNHTPPPTIQIPTWNSATGALGPRIIRFGVTYWFSK